MMILTQVPAGVLNVILVAGYLPATWPMFVVVIAHTASIGLTPLWPRGRTRCGLREALGAPVPALIVTGDTAPERLREASAGGYPLLHKPVSPMALRTTLNRLLRGPGARTSQSPVT